MSKSTTKDPGISIDLAKLGAATEDAITVADASRARSLARFAQIHTARANMLMRERDSLPADAPADERASVEAALAATNELGHALAVDAAVAAAPPPAPAAGETVVHGVVEGASGVKVTVSDASGHTSDATTAANGRFIIRHRPAKSDPPERLQLRVHGDQPSSVDLGAHQPVLFVVVRRRH